MKENCEMTLWVCHLCWAPATKFSIVLGTWDTWDRKINLNSTKCQPDSSLELFHASIPLEFRPLKSESNRAQHTSIVLVSGGIIACVYVYLHYNSSRLTISHDVSRGGGFWISKRPVRPWKCLARAPDRTQNNARTVTTAILIHLSERSEERALSQTNLSSEISESCGAQELSRRLAH